MCLDDDAVHDNARGHVWKKRPRPPVTFSMVMIKKSRSLMTWQSDATMSRNLGTCMPRGPDPFAARCGSREKGVGGGAQPKRGVAGREDPVAACEGRIRWRKTYDGSGGVFEEQVTHLPPRTL